MKFVKRLLAGIAIGIASAIPGVSGGTVAVILKVYESITWSVSNIFKHFKQAIVILLPILLGVILALIPCIFLFDKALQYFVFGIVCLFAGFMLGSLPSLYKEIKEEEKTKKRISILIVAALIAIAIGVGSVFLGKGIDVSSHMKNPEWWFFIILIPVGILASAALVVPGISGSMLLLIIGFYQPLLNTVTEWFKNITSGNWSTTGTTFAILGCFLVGVLIGFFFISKLMNYLITSHRTITYFAIFGFVVGSIITLFFNNTIYNYYVAWANRTQIGLDPEIEIAIGVALLILGTMVVYFLFKKYQPKEIKE